MLSMKSDNEYGTTCHCDRSDDGLEIDLTTGTHDNGNVGSGVTVIVVVRVLIIAVGTVVRPEEYTLLASLPPHMLRGSAWHTVVHDSEAP
jgi:hypothetical protein